MRISSDVVLTSIEKNLSPFFVCGVDQSNHALLGGGRDKRTTEKS
jgi:hypothetical protein